METQNKEEYIYLARKHDIDRSEEEEKDSVRQKEQTEHLAGVVIFPAVEKTVYPSDGDIPYECAEESDEQQDQRQKRIYGRTCLLTECARKHPSHERKDDKQQRSDYSSDKDADKHFTDQLPSAEVAWLIKEI